MQYRGRLLRANVGFYCCDYTCPYLYHRRWRTASGCSPNTPLPLLNTAYTVYSYSPKAYDTWNGHAYLPRCSTCSAHSPNAYRESGGICYPFLLFREGSPSFRIRGDHHACALEERFSRQRRALKLTKTYLPPIPPLSQPFAPFHANRPLPNLSVHPTSNHSQSSPVTTLPT